jgi:predicted DNA-binding protein YlxM (UPF0122 family)
MLADFRDYSKEQIEEAINSTVIACLHAERNREILKKSLIDGKTVKELANEFKLSNQSIEKILMKNNKLLIDYLNI